ncbi:MAG: FAD-dependent oxidoreductase [Candidatus Limnocylindrales bacterium]
MEVAADVVVVGAGLAGTTAALRARELGARTVLLEMSADEAGWSNSRMSGARYHAAGMSPTVGYGAIVARAQSETGGTTDEALAVAWASNCERSYRWLRAQGVRFAVLHGVPVMAPIRPNRRGEVWSGYGADTAVRRLLRLFSERGGEYRTGTRVVRLKSAQGSVCGVEAIDVATDASLDVSARAVILSDGGFQSNLSMLRDIAHIRRPDLLVQRGAATGMGDGLRMATEVGGRVINGEALYAHLIHRDGATNPDLCHYPMLDALAAASIVVDGRGARVCDESMGGIAIANRIARLEDPMSCWLVFDRLRWDTVGRRNQIVPPNPNLLLAGARLESGWTSAELGRHTGLDAVRLAESLTQGGRTVADQLPERELRPPYFAVPVAVGLTFTMGGIAITPATQVRKDDRSVVVGLYAAGTTSGGLSGGPKPGYVGGISIATTLGLIAAESACGSTAA